MHDHDVGQRVKGARVGALGVERRLRRVWGKCGSCQQAGGVGNPDSQSSPGHTVHYPGNEQLAYQLTINPFVDSQSTLKGGMTTRSSAQLGWGRNCSWGCSRWGWGRGRGWGRGCSRWSAAGASHQKIGVLCVDVLQVYGDGVGVGLHQAKVSAHARPIR